MNYDNESDMSGTKDTRPTPVSLLDQHEKALMQLLEVVELTAEAFSFTLRSEPPMPTARDEDSPREPQSALSDRLQEANNTVRVATQRLHRIIDRIG